MNEQGEIALVTNGVGTWWGFPKGHIDEGENETEAAVREIEEETGLRDLTLVKKLGSYERYRGTKDGGEDTSELKEIHMFYFTSSKVPLISQDPANPEARWFSVSDVAGTLTHAKDREFFARIRDELAAG